MAKTITLKHDGFYCTGFAVINHWGGGQSKVEMDSWVTETIDPKEIVKGVNDGQFGCESIKSAAVEVYDLYEKGFSEYNKTIDFSAEELKDATRGIG